MAANGRVGDIYNKNTSQAFEYDYKDLGGCENDEFSEEVTKGMMATTHVSQLFFSVKNVEALQHGIRYGVYKRTCKRHVISNQSNDELKVIMRSVYLQHSKNLSYDILEQVRELNGKVLNYAIDYVVKELDMYERYRKDVSALPVPLERGVFESSAGLKSGTFKGF